jgi:hypothetical protein
VRDLNSSSISDSSKSVLRSNLGFANPFNTAISSILGLIPRASSPDCSLLGRRIPAHVPFLSLNRSCLGPSMRSLGLKRPPLHSHALWVRPDKYRAAGQIDGQISSLLIGTGNQNSVSGIHPSGNSDIFVWY